MWAWWRTQTAIGWRSDSTVSAVGHGVVVTLLALVIVPALITLVWRAVTVLHYAGVVGVA